MAMTIKDIVVSLLDLVVDPNCPITMESEVFMGNLYQDHPVEEIVIEDGYPLIVNKDIL